MNYNDRNDTDVNSNLHHGDISSGIGLLDSHTLSQDNESINLNDMNMSVENGDVNGDHFYINSSTRYESNNHNSIGYTNKRDSISTYMYLMVINVLPDGVGIDFMFPASTLNQCANMEFKNEHNNLLSNGNI